MSLCLGTLSMNIEDNFRGMVFVMSIYPCLLHGSGDDTVAVFSSPTLWCRLPNLSQIR